MLYYKHGNEVLVMSDLQKKIISSDCFKGVLKSTLENSELFDSINFDNLTLDDIKKISDFMKTEDICKSFGYIIGYQMLDRILEDNLTNYFCEAFFEEVEKEKGHYSYYPYYVYSSPFPEDSAREYFINNTKNISLFFKNALDSDVILPDNNFLQRLIIKEEISKLDSKKYKYAFIYGLVSEDAILEKKLKVDRLDLYDMIKKYEKSGDVLSISTLKNFHFRLVYFLSRKCNRELFSKIENEYDKYRRENIFFLINDFVTYYNQKYGDDVSSLVGADKPMLLSDEIFRLVFLKDKNFCFAGFFDLLVDTRNGTEYINEFKNMYAKVLDDELEKNSIERYAMFAYNPETVCNENMKKQPLGYFLLKNIPEKYWEAFTEMIGNNRYRKFYEKFCNLDKQDYIFIDEELEKDLKLEAEKTDIRKLTELSQKYREYRNLCQLKPIVNDYIILDEMEKRERELSVCFIKDCLRAMDTSMNLYDFHINSDKYAPFEFSYGYFANCLCCDGDRLFKHAHEVDPTLEKDISIVKKRYYDDKEKYILKQKELKKTKGAILGEYDKILSINSAIHIIQGFVNSDCRTVKDYCLKNNLDHYKFSKHLKVIEENCPELYEKYNTKVLKYSQEKFAAIMGNVNNIIGKIVNGVPKEDGTFRPFNYLDYKLATTNELDEFMKLAKKSYGLTKQELAKVSNFVNSNKTSMYMKNEDFLAGTYSYRLQDGSFYTASQEDKEKVLDYLRYKGFPNDTRLLKIALREHVFGDINLDLELSNIKGTKKTL